MLDPINVLKLHYGRRITLLLIYCDINNLCDNSWQIVGQDDKQKSLMALCTGRLWNKRFGNQISNGPLCITDDIYRETSEKEIGVHIPAFQLHSGRALTLLSIASAATTHATVLSKCLFHAMQKLAGRQGGLNSSNLFHLNRVLQQHKLANYRPLSDLLYCQPSAPEDTEITGCATKQTSAQLTGDKRVGKNACLSRARGQHEPGLHAGKAEQ